MWEGGRSWTSLFIGMFLILLSIIPILNTFGILNYSLPFEGVILGMSIFIVAIFGFYLIIDGFFEGHFSEHIGIITMSVGALMFTLSLIVILNQFGVVAFTVPYLSGIVVWIILLIEGLLSFIGAFMQQ